MRNDVEDIDLLEKFKNGDEGAFETLYSKYSSYVERYINSFIKDKDLAEEMMQEIFIILYKNADKYNGKCKVINYIIAITKKKILVYFRNLSLREEKFNRYAKDFYDGDKVSLSALELLEKKEDSEEITEILNNMNPTYSMAIKLVDFCELSYEQTANLMGKSLNQIKITVHRARKTLEKEMRRKHPDTVEKYSKGKRDTLGFVLACIIGVSLLTGLAYAAIKIYQNHIENKETFKLSEKENIIDESEVAIDKEHAKEIIDKYLKVLGCSDYDLDSVVLEKDPKYDMVFWKFKNNDFRIRVDANTGLLDYYNNFKDFSNLKRINESIDINSRIDELILKLNYSKDDKTKNIFKTKLEGDLTLDEITYSNEYDLYDSRYEQITIAYIEELDFIKDIRICNFHNGEINITKEEAISIVKDYYDVDEIQKIDFNTDDVYIPNKTKDYYSMYGIEDVMENIKYPNYENGVRKLWIIKLIKDGEEIVVYVDAQNGEIIKKQESNLESEKY